MKRKTTLLLAISICLSTSIVAQDYTVEHSINTYEPLINANLLNESNPEIDPSGSDRYQAIPIGFDFIYHNNTFNSLKVGENGYVIFEQNGVFESFINIFECKQMNFQSDSLLSPIYYEVSGNPGNQIFKLEFVKSGFVNDSQEDDYINYQLWIYEYCNVFEFHIGDLSIDPAELDLFYNNAPAPFMGYGNNDPYFYYVLDGSLTTPALTFNAFASLDSIPNSNSVYTFRNCFLNIEEEKTNSFSLHPNPATDIVNIIFSDDIETSELTILNLNGQIVYTDILSLSNSYSFNTDFLAPGVYVIEITSAKTTYSTKLVKQ